jgi:hypothetical protein
MHQLRLSSRGDSKLEWIPVGSRGRESRRVRPEKVIRERTGERVADAIDPGAIEPIDILIAREECGRRPRRKPRPKGSAAGIRAWLAA